MQKLFVIITMISSSYNVLITDYATRRLLEISPVKPYCTIIDDRYEIMQMLRYTHDRNDVLRIPEETLEHLKNICSNQKLLNLFHGGFIYPGTKWCGPGNAARDYNDLGPFKSEDQCCREHDHCTISLKPGECRQNLCNPLVFTKSHCNCDKKFKKCLQKINSDTANAIGIIFFNIAQVLCIKEKEKSCAARANNKNCTLIFQPSEPYIRPRNEETSRKCKTFSFLTHLKSFCGKIYSWITG